MSKITQEKGSAENFGDFSLTLPLGSYTMVVIGRDVLEGDAPSTLRQAQGPPFDPSTSSGTVGPSTSSGDAINCLVD